MNRTTSAIATVDEARRATRTHLFVAAMLHSDAGLAPVNIRNMSPTGALIESPAIPDVGEAVTLKRGTLQIAGRIAWKAERKAGVAFCTAACVAEWMARQPTSGQERVDRIVSDLKAGKPTADANIRPRSASVAAELKALRIELVELGSSLISDANVVATHPEIQILDISLQRVDRMISQLGHKA